MTFDIEMLFVDSVDGAERVATSITHKDIVTGLSAALAPQTVAVLHMLYPRTDARTHASLDSLVEALNRHSMHQVARLVAEKAHYVLFRNPIKAWRVLHEIRNDSLAIGVHVYYKGLAGGAAEQMLDADARDMRRR
ncbi:hypothetical protein FVF58_47615 [Paraburkholderia panacisoli]|uniref:Uncharacterized protein n=1 Tax=Paraburkholderia panacisoli TaxID=2603818 RepID=A0A5B0G2Y5_9BURK|nr:hypothetical protein [Paraburkholderia panacisoli]KAA0997766.1 hypothetical protein FVF58_47615 [Paraburkholderia panacisoli]